MVRQEREVLVRLMPQILDFVQDLGWEVNLDKSSLVLSLTFQYLGLHFVTDLDLVRPADHLLVRIESRVLQLRAQLQSTPQKLQEFFGLVNFFALLVCLSRLLMMLIQF